MGGIRGVCGLDDYMGYWDLESLAMNWFYKIILWLKKRFRGPLNGPGAGPVFRPIFRRVSNGFKTPEQINNGRESVY